LYAVGFHDEALAMVALTANRAEADHVKVWQAVGKLRRRHGLVISGEARESGYRVENWLWAAGGRGLRFGAVRADGVRHVAGRRRG